MSVTATGVRLSSTDGISLTALRRYFSVIIPANLIWEFAHMPLYTIWNEGTWGEIVFAAVHCTGGDILIAMSALVLGHAAQNPVRIDDGNAIGTSFPGFIDLMNGIGADIAPE